MAVEHLPVVSTNIASIGYDHCAKALEVKFKAGTLYRYSDVPDHVWQHFASSESKGKHFAQYIRGAFAGDKIA